MIPPQYPGVRYQPPYVAIEQQMSHMPPHQPQHVQATGGSGTSGSPPAVPANEEDSTQEADASQHSVLPQQPQQIPMHYNVPPPGAYYGGTMGMHPRGPGYPPQFVGGPQQIPVRPGAGPYSHMYPMQPGSLPPNMHMRGPGAAPYYPGPNGPIPYPPGGYGVNHGMMDDDPGFRGRGGRGSGGRGRRGRGRGGGRGPGRGGYNIYNPQQGGTANPQHTGRQTPQQVLSGGHPSESNVGGQPTDPAPVHLSDGASQNAPES